MTIEVVFDGKVFVPTGSVDLPAGATAVVALPPPPTAAERAEAERILKGDGSPPPWGTVEEALGRPRYEP